MNTEKRICSLCGREIVREKGMNQKAYLYALQRGAHINCLKAHEKILRKHHISPNDYLNAVIEGLFLLFPKLAETDSVRGYKDRMQKAEEEIGGVFPNLKKQKREGEKKAVAKKEDEEEGGGKEK